MNKEKYTTIFYVILIALFAALILFNQSNVKALKKQKAVYETRIKSCQKQVNYWKERALQVSSVQKTVDEVSKYREKGYYSWIIQHSTRCPASIAKIIAKEAIKSEIGIILLALVQRESSFNPFARSKAGAMGLGQIMPSEWVDELGKAGIVQTKRDLYDPVVNMRATAYIFKKYYKQSGENIVKALYKYVGKKDKKYVNDILQNVGDLVCYLKLTT